MTNKLIHDKAEHRFVLMVDDGIEAYVSYELRSNEMYLTYSYVPSQLRGQGVGQKLVEETFALLTKEGFIANAVCSYIKKIALSSSKWKTIIK
ncbi:MAG: N-acetyltransferase [Flavobacteriales bacterium]|nr:N-acetyltransferase [Flavobacteriales bacterium]